MTRFAFLFDTDYAYASKLGNYLSMNNTFPFVVCVCKTKQELIEMSNRENTSIVLISEKEHIKSDIFKSNEIILLSEKNTQEFENKKYVNKYQNGEKIVKDILSMLSLSEGMKSIISRKNKLKVLAFYTPVKRSLSTTMCIAMGQLLGKRTKTLYINFECFSGLKSMLNCDFQKNIGDLLYYMANHNTGFGVTVSGIVESIEGLDIIPSFDNQLDLIEVKSQTWLKLINNIECETDYEYLLLDLSDSVQGLFDILKIADKVITSVDNDEVAIFKLMKYEECLKVSGFEEVIEKTKKCNVPHQHRKNGEIHFLGYGELGEYVKTVLQGVIEENAD